STLCQDHHQRYNAIDVLSYRFEIDLNDSSDVISGAADIVIAFKKDVEQFHLDLANTYPDNTGMTVKQITEDGRDVSFQHQNNRILLNIPKTQQGSKRNYRIIYSGIPSDGLIISRNKFGDRTFFGDNWPNRGHHWLPLVDHPSDKALVSFIVHAPDHYGVVSVGKRISEKSEEGRVSSHWQTSVPLSTKLMVIGVSPFAVEELQSQSGVPVSTWVYPQNREEGFFDYSIATRPLDFFESYIAPFPYSKLANVQSKTVYGGMENASCIFYHERTVNGKQDHEHLFAHEIAHQWFGDAVSELDWHHIWLSEGFATYLTDIYIEQIHGREAFVESMLDEKRQVIRFARRRLAPIVDTTLPVSTRLLNKNSYEKAGWVLHMLRHDMGDELFHECVLAFYEKFKFSNALTEDFQAVAESVSGKDYNTFFRQWFYQAGHPVLSAHWKKRGKRVHLEIIQHQEHHLFVFPLDIKFSNGKGEVFRETLSIHSASQSFTFKPPFKPADLVLDPDSWLLFEDH
ncbi:MAG: M1 family metallopeptidase, partial [Bacteroidota bacterium]|nr:M1 family metallopeptidase [Bacteroidota bacterium]